MSNIKIVTGNIFTTQCQTIVNTTNCVGVMGAGIAFECRLRFPEMYKKYMELCSSGLIDIGVLYIHKEDSRWILNFPTKKHWKHDSKEEYLKIGLQKFIDTYQQKKITSIAFPLLGASRGGIDPQRSIDIMMSYLFEVSIPVEIYKYNPTAKDDLYDKFKKIFLSFSKDDLRLMTGLRTDLINKIIHALDDASICQLNQLINQEGIGEKTLEKSFSLVMRPVSSNQQSLL